MNSNWGRRLFRAGGVWLLVLGCVHSLSLFAPQGAANDTEKQLLDLMSNYKFSLMGSMRSMDNLMRGFSISFMVAALGFGVLSLALSREREPLLKKLALIIALWLAVMFAVSLRYFFAVPSSFLAVALALFLAAWWRLSHASAR